MMNPCIGHAPIGILSAARRFWGHASVAHQQHANHQQEGARKPDQIDGMPWYVEQVVVVEDQGGEYLSSDKQGHERHRVNAGNEHDRDADMDSAEQPAAPCQPIAAGQSPGLGHPVAQNLSKNQLAERSTEVAHASCPCSGVQACTPICMDRLLHDETERRRSGDGCGSLPFRPGPTCLGSDHSGAGHRLTPCRRARGWPQVIRVSAWSRR